MSGRWIVSLPLILLAGGCLGSANGSQGVPSGSVATESTVHQQPVPIGGDRTAVFIRYRRTSWPSLPELWTSQQGVLRRRVTLPPKIQVNSPMLSPDGRMVAFDDAQVYGDGAEAIVVARLESGIVTPLLRGVNLTGALIWSPDSRRLAYSAWTGKPGGPCLYVISVRTGRVTRVTSHPIRARDASPVWTPDGRSLLFVRGTPTGQRTLLVNVHTHALRTLPAAADRPDVFNLSWQPHGDLIVGQQGASDMSPIVVATVRSAGFAPLSPKLEGAPIGWSSDGRFLLVRQIPAPSSPSSGPLLSLPPPPSCAELVTYDVQTRTSARIACAGPATWERGVDRVMFTWLQSTGGMITEGTRAPLWSIAATGSDRRLITRNSAFTALPTLSVSAGG